MSVREMVSDYAKGRRKVKDPVERFMAKVRRDEASGCWLWTAAVATSGYGVFGLFGKYVQAHRAAMVLFKGVTLERGHGREVDHLCRVKTCVNPDHLEYVTQQENLRRSRVAMYGADVRVACKNGHPFAGGNLWVHRDGSRRCRACHSALMRKYVAAKTGRVVGVRGPIKKYADGGIYL